MQIRSIIACALVLAFWGCKGTPNDGEAPADKAATEQAAEGEKATPEKAAEKAATAEEAAAPEKAAAPAKAAVNPALLDPSKATEQAPAEYTVELDTTKGKILIDVKREWAPIGADRFYNLVKMGYYTDVAFFRVIKGFMAQIGLHGTPEVTAAWRQANLKDDPVKQSNGRGFVTFATAGPNTRTTQFFINFADNKRLDGMGFSPFAKIQDASMEVVDSLYSGYGEGAPRGKGPAQGRIHREGNAYLKKDFPELDYIKSAKVVGQ